MNLPASQTNSEITKVQDQKRQDLQKALFFAFERTKSDPFDVSGLITDVLTEFPKLSSDRMIEALRNGGLGKYGRTFRLSTQEVCYWIREYLKPNKQERI